MPPKRKRTLELIKTDQVDFLSNLHSDLLGLIFKYIRPQYYMFLKLVCKRFYQMYGKTFYKKSQLIEILLKDGYASLISITKYKFTHLELRSAAAEGHLDILKLARKNGYYYWNENLTLEAAYHGQLETLQWLVRDGCPMFNQWFNQWQTSHIFKNHKSVYYWMRANGYITRPIY